MEPTDEMIEAGAEYLYGHSRAQAIEWAKEDKFDSKCQIAREVYLAMLKAQKPTMEEDHG